MSSLIPPGCQAILMGAAASAEDLNTFMPLEEGTAEGSLMLMRLDFADFPTSEALTELNKALLDKGIPAWPGYSYIVYADSSTPSVFLAWQKGMAWMAVIIGAIAVTVLPMLLGALCWLILPQSLKDLISSISELGMMMGVMWLMSTITKPLMATAKEKPKLEKAKQQEEATT